MAVVNRTLDTSEQRIVLRCNQSVDVVNGSTLTCGVVPSPAIVEAVQVAARGLSGAPTLQLGIWRFLTGTGATTIIGGFTVLTLVTEGTSGVQSAVLASSGSTLLNLLANDQIVAVQAGGTGAATKGISINALIRYTQDIKTSYGV